MSYKEDLSGRWPLRTGQKQALHPERAVCERSRACNDKVVDVIAESWVERGEAHRTVAFQLAHDSLKAAAKKGLPIESWRDADLADRSARRNAGLDDSEARNASIGMALINYRLEHLIHLPKDALPE